MPAPQSWVTFLMAFRMGGAKDPIKVWEIGSRDAVAASDARRQFREHLSRNRDGIDSVREAEIVFGELVANALRCARRHVIVEVEIGDRVILRVIDDGDCFDLERVGQAAPQSAGGRGLQIATALTHRLTVEQNPTGCVVTAVLRV